MAAEPLDPTDYTCKSNSDCDEFKGRTGYTNLVCGTMEYEIDGKPKSHQ